jgi:hypothetical protein
MFKIGAKGVDRWGDAASFGRSRGLCHADLRGIGRFRKPQSSFLTGQPEVIPASERFFESLSKGACIFNALF